MKNYEAIFKDRNAAIKKGLEEIGFEYSEISVKEWMDNDIITINEARNGREVVWIILDANHEVAIYSDTLEIMTEEEMEEQLI